MRKLDVSAVTDSVGLPVKGGTLVHLQYAYQEALAALGKGLVGAAYDENKVYVLNGCVNTGVGSNYEISAGAVYFNGEVFLVDAVSFSISGAQVAVAVIDTSYFADSTADPVEFTDGVLRNIHEIRKVVLQPGLNGSGIANYNDFIDLNKRLHGTIGEIKIWNWRFYGGTLSTYFNIATGLGIHPYTLGWAIADGQNGTDSLSGLVPVGYSASDEDFSEPFENTGGVKEVTLTKSQLPTTVGEIPASSDGTPGVNGVNFDGLADVIFPINNELGGNAHTNMQPYRSVLYVQRIA